MRANFVFQRTNEDGFCDLRTTVQYTPRKDGQRQRWTETPLGQWSARGQQLVRAGPAYRDQNAATKPTTPVDLNKQRFF